MSSKSKTKAQSSRKTSPKGAPQRITPQGDASSSGTRAKQPITPKEITFSRFDIWSGIVILLVVIGVVWSVPRMCGDLFIALAGGRDVTAGLLGAPDQWSALTNGRVWFNQNWGTHLIYYLLQRSFGDNGLLCLKMLLIGLCAFFTILAVRRRRAPLAVASLTVALVLISIQSFIDLRPNLISLMFTPCLLWLLYRTWEKPSQIWITVGLTTLWANLHGGFILGLGMMLLWTVCLMVTAVISQGKAGLLRYWQFLAAWVAAVLLAGIATPFGWANLTFPFGMLSQSSWRQVAEWQPIWTNAPFGSVWEFIVLAALLLILSLYNFLKRTTLRKEESRSRWEQLGPVVFDFLLCGIMIVMAIVSRRFIPLALLLITPMLAVGIWRWIEIRGVMRARAHAWWMTLIMLSALILAGVRVYDNWRYYSPNNPLGIKGTVFERMHLTEWSFPAQLAEFINDNQIQGNTFNRWEWEGYLHFRCPQLKVFLGGRAQQVYDEEQNLLFRDILESPSPGKLLVQNQVHWVATSMADTQYKNLVNHLIKNEGWVMVYNDNRNCLLLDSAWGPSRAIIERALQGRFTFRDQGVGLLSQAACMLSPAVNGDPEQTLTILKKSLENRPSSWGYKALPGIAAANPKLTPQVVDFLRQEQMKLAKMSLNQPNGGEIISCLYHVSGLLMEYYRMMGMKEPELEAQQVMEAAQKISNQMIKQWTLL
ncbi:MAG TPA: hypothetical protein VHY08_22700 [Bacillota bacterium]|nr:hypothetical protein [Bacillota bacterium]